MLTEEKALRKKPITEKKWWLKGMKSEYSGIEKEEGEWGKGENVLERRGSSQEQDGGEEGGRWGPALQLPAPG